MLPHPPMTFSPESLLNERAVRDGPLVVWWGQEHEMPAPDPLMKLGRPPRRKLRQWILRQRPFAIELRLQPPEGTPLEEFGLRVCELLDLPQSNEPRETHKAVWVSGGVYAREARQALGSTAAVFNKLEGVMISAAQVRVWDWREGPPAQGESVAMAIEDSG